MNKILITLVLAIGLSGNVFAVEPWTTHKFIEEYQQAKETTEEDFLTNIETYIAGISKGVVMSNLYFGALGKGNLFCPPKDKRFTSDEMIHLIMKMDEEFKKGNTVYPHDPLEAPLETTIIWTLMHFYPCE